MEIRTRSGLRMVRCLVAILLGAGLCGCSSTRYYVVRHAEKLDNSADPPLSAVGKQRAERLAEELADKRIGGIFVSNLQRTKQTAAPTAQKFGVAPTVVPARDTNGLIERLKAVSGENVLVVRHSNEIDLIVNGLSPSDTIGPISEAEYDNLFVIERCTSFGKTAVELQRLKY